MHIFTTSEDMTGNVYLPTGSYLAEDYNAAHFMLNAKRGTAKLQSTAIGEKFSEQSRNVLVIKPGAFGDLLLMTPIFRRAKELCPDCKISVSVAEQYAPVLIANQYIDELVDYPVCLNKIKQYDTVIVMENSIEGNPDAGNEHAVDLFAKKFGVQVKDRTLVYNVTEDELAWALARYPRVKDVKRVAVQLQASTKSRTYPQHLLTEVLVKLLKSGIEVYALGSPYEEQSQNRGFFRNLTLEGLNIRQSIAAMLTCDLVLAPDSVMIHAASALNIPAIGLFGPVQWPNRITSTKLYALQGCGNCKPCNWVIEPATGHFPPNCPSREQGHCELLAGIKPERIVAKVNLALK